MELMSTSMKWRSSEPFDGLVVGFDEILVHNAHGVV